MKPPKVFRSPIENDVPLRPLPAVKRSYVPAARPGRPVRLTMTLLAAVAAPVVTMRSKVVREPTSRPREAEPAVPAPRLREPEPRLIVWPTVLLRLRIAPVVTLTEEVCRAADWPPVMLRRPPVTVVWPT